MGLAGDMIMTARIALLMLAELQGWRGLGLRSRRNIVILRIPRSHCRRIAFDRRRNDLLFLELLRSPCCEIPFGCVYLRLAVMRYYAAYNLRFAGIACRRFFEHKITRESNAFWNMRKNK